MERGEEKSENYVTTLDTHKFFKINSKVILSD